MLTRDARTFVDALATCERISVLVEHGAGSNPQEMLSEKLKKLARKHLRDLEQAIDGMDTRAALASVRNARAMLRKEMSFKQLGDINKDIYSRFRDEMKGRSIFFLDEREAALFAVEKSPFGDLVAEPFQLPPLTLKRPINP